MKKIGLVGGISWTSTMDYYRFINQEINERLGGLNFAECLIYSVNYNDFRACTEVHNWEGGAALLTNAATQLEKAGADMILLCANTAHIVAENVSAAIQIPLIDIRTVTIDAIHAKGLKKVGLLGTTFTMEMDFYKDKLRDGGINPIIPGAKADRDFMEETLHNELGKGILKKETKQQYLKMIHELMQHGAEGIILGCTEIPLLIQQEDVPVPVFNTTQLHALAAVEQALA